MKLVLEYLKQINSIITDAKEISKTEKRNETKKIRKEIEKALENLEKMFTKAVDCQEDIGEVLYPTTFTLSEEESNLVDKEKNKLKMLLDFTDKLLIGTEDAKEFVRNWIEKNRKESQ